MYRSKWSALVVSALLHLLVCGPTSGSCENVTISVNKEVQHNGNINQDMNSYSILQSNPVAVIRNLTLLDSPQAVTSDITKVSTPSSYQHEERQYTSSLLEYYVNSEFSTLSSPSKTKVESSTYIVNAENNDSTESNKFSSSSNMNDDTQLYFLHPSSISEFPAESKDVGKFNGTKVETFSQIWPSSGAGRSSASQPGGQIADTTLSEVGEQSTVSSTTDTGINAELHNSPLQKDYAKNILNVTTEEVIVLAAVTTDVPLTPSVQHSPANHVDFHSGADMSPINETASYSSDTNANSFPVNTTVAVSQPKSSANFPQNEGRQHSIDYKRLNKSTVPESNTETENLMTSNASHHPFVSETTINPLSTSSVSNNNLKRIPNEELQVISPPAYHPNDVIHVSSSELYASDSSHNISHEEKHPCARICKEGALPMVCKYRFELEWYYTMSKACYNCPLHLEDCSRKDCVVGDGVRRPIVVVNRQMPGPSVEVCKGDRIIVDMENHLMTESTSIHWHGHHQRGTPYMDGVPYVTQCPIPPKSSFRYHYTADTPGTHFWHSHSGCQRADGVFGALIIRVPTSSDPHRELYDHDLSEHIVQILDWDDKLGVDKFLAHHHANGNNKPKTLLVNGRGRFHQFQDVNSVTVNVTHSPTATFTVQQGFRYRFRLINAGFLNCPIELSVDNHTLLVISSDGADVQPVQADSLVSYAGERFDFVLHANKKVGNYWMRFRGLMDCDERFTKAHQVAVLHYVGAPLNKEPPGEVSYEEAHRKGLQVNSLNVGTGSTAGSLVIPELDAIADDDASLKEEPDFRFYLSYDFYEIDNPHYHRSPFYGFHQVSSKLQRLLTPQLNHISLRLPPFPLLSQHNDLGTKYPFCNETTVSGCENKYCECTHVIEVPLGTVLELIIIDKGKAFDANHPFHLHGHAFRVIAMKRLNRTTTVEEVQARDKMGLIHRKLKRAPFKDTITVPDGGFTIVRVHASNPGYWLFHCHIEFHVELGMAVVFKVGQHEEFSSPPPGFPRCGNYMPSEQDLEHTNSDVDNAVDAHITSTPNWRPLKSTSGSGSFKISVLPNFALLLLLCAAVR